MQILFLIASRHLGDGAGANVFLETLKTLQALVDVPQLTQVAPGIVPTNWTILWEQHALGHPATSPLYSRYEKQR